MKNKLLNLTSIFQRWNHTQTQRWAKACCMFLELFHFSPWRGVQSHLYSTFSSPLLIRLSLSLPPPKTPNPLPLPPEINITPFFCYPLIRPCTARPTCFGSRHFSVKQGERESGWRGRAHRGKRGRVEWWEEEEENKGGSNKWWDIFSFFYMIRSENKQQIKTTT